MEVYIKVFQEIFLPCLFVCFKEFASFDFYQLFVKFENQGESSKEADEVPIPKVIIDQDSDPDATIVEITFGDRLGALLDTVSCCLPVILNTNIYFGSLIFPLFCRSSNSSMVL